MKHLHRLVTARAAAVALACGCALPQAHAVFRCENNYYTNDANEARAKNCRPVDGASVTVVPGRAAGAAPAAGRPAGSGAPPAGASAGNPTGAAAGANAPRVSSSEQRARDTDARQILESELRKAESRRAELLREFNNGEPERRGDEVRNYQKYLDRVAEMKANIGRADADVEGLRREIGRLPPPAGSR